ncbi:EAL domain-containing protein [Bacillus shivajii]|uniref:EAL domain-containing protein n=1 Tax=Bacillus shivajii TaxID=1983719 RepID=UPI001CFB2273|nr:EAL domain-containing protein [Bacillus shivajii]UCZ53923.1 EAL domain-containing protein [Bacillus shivajii]
MNKELDILNQRNRMMVTLLWLLLMFTVVTNIILLEYDPTIINALIFIAILGIPVCTILTWMTYKRIYIESTMYFVTLTVLLILFILNFVDKHPINLFVLLLAPILSMFYRQWKNILLSIIGSFLIFLFFVSFNSDVYFAHWNAFDIVYFFLFYLVLAFVMILEAKLSEGRRIKAEKKVEFMAYHDNVTGLANINYFYELLEHSINQSHHINKEIGIILLDLDNFKKVNDSMGHQFGDQLLKDVACRLEICMKDKGTLCRMGGDEFLLLISEVDEEEMHSIAKKLQHEFEKPFLIDGMYIHVTTSMGISFYPSDGKSADTLIKYADIAMYRSKDRGKNDYHFFKPTMNTSTYSEFILENDLRKALAEEEFKVYYQPFIDIETGEINGMEALLRWDHPDKGIISPDKFIPLAEETGLILPIGEWVLRTACKQIREWQNEGFPPINVSVNLSLRQFLQQDLCEKISEIIKENELDPRCLELEITESIAMDINYTMRILKRLKKLGIKISMDDFGTGYSSLSNLKNLPIDKLKIDKSFIHDIRNPLYEVEVVSTIITLAKNLRLQVVAEGVETENQLQFLEKEKCDAFQGYLFSKPLPASEIEELLKKEHKVSVS